jgi:hypothetical protein
LTNSSLHCCCRSKQPKLLCIWYHWCPHSSAIVYDHHLERKNSFVFSELLTN